MELDLCAVGCFQSRRVGLLHGGAVGHDSWWDDTHLCAGVNEEPPVPGKVGDIEEGRQCWPARLRWR